MKWQWVVARGARFCIQLPADVTKSGVARMVPIDSRVRQELEAFKVERCIGRDLDEESYVIPSPRLGRGREGSACRLRGQAVFKRVNKWMRDQGWQLRASFFPEGACPLLPETHNYDWIARVAAPMGSHAVIFRGNEFLYDPDDFAKYTIEDVTAWYAIEPLAPCLEERPFRTIEGEVERIGGDDRGQQRRRRPVARGDEVTRIDPAVRDAAADRRAHGGEFDVEAARADARLGGGERGSGGVDSRPQRVDLALGHRIVGDQSQRARQVALGER